MNIFLEIFLFVDVFIIGAAFAVALRHAYAHRHPEIQAKPTPPNPNSNLPLGPEAREKLLLEAEARYRRILDRNTDQLSKELGVTAEKINEAVKKISGEILKKEEDDFNQLVKQYQDSANQELSGAKVDTEKYKQEMKAQVEIEVSAEKKRRIDQINNQMTDVVMSFLTEALQHEVDLGAQADYLMKLLEKHKQEFKRAVQE